MDLINTLESKFKKINGELESLTNFLLIRSKYRSDCDAIDYKYFSSKEPFGKN